MHGGQTCKGGGGSSRENLTQQLIRRGGKMSIEAPVCGNLDIGCQHSCAVPQTKKEKKNITMNKLGHFPVYANVA